MAYWATPLDSPEFGERGDLRSNLAEADAERARTDPVEQQLLRGAVHQQDLLVAIGRDDAGGDRFEHGLGERPPVLQLMIGADQGLGLLFDLRGHAVERAVEQAHLVGRVAPRHAHREIAAADPASGVDQLVERLDLAIGEAQRQPDEEPDQGERQDPQRRIDAQLQQPCALGELFVGAHDILRALALAEGEQVRYPGGVEIHAGAAVDRGDGLDLVGAGVDHDRLAGVEPAHRLGRNALAGRIAARIDDGERAQLAILALLDDRQFVEPAIVDLVGIELRKARTGERFGRKERAHVARHRRGFLADVALDLLVIAARELVGVLEQAARIVGEPEFDPRLEQPRGEDHHQQRRNRRDHRKQEHQLDMHAARAATALGRALQGEPASEQDQKRHRRHEDPDQQRRSDVGRQQLAAFGLA